MKKKNIVRSYIIFLIGLVIVSLGVAIVTKASLGMSPIAAIPYSVSLIISGISMGKCVIVFNTGLALVQPLMLPKEVNKVEIGLQVVMAFLFGSFVDLSLYIVDFFQPQMYISRLATLIVGCTIIAFGTYLELVGDVVMLPGHAFVRTLSKVINVDYGKTSVISDSTMTIVAGILCLVFLGELAGVREGTLISALITGNILRIFTSKLKWINK